MKDFVYLSLVNDSVATYGDTVVLRQDLLPRGPEIGVNRWNNRVVSNSDDWSDNVFDFWFKTYPMLSEGLPVLFGLSSDIQHVDATPQHRAIREVFGLRPFMRTTSGVPAWSSYGSQTASSRPTQACSGSR
jgi:hypothetical protein